MSEEWRPVPGWPYEVSSRGRVRRDGRLLKPTPDKDGYRHVTLSAGPRRWRVHVGRLVLLVFRGEPEPGQEACHGNGRRWDNRLANLRWDTKPGNRADRERHRAERAARAAEIRHDMSDLEGREGDTGVSAPCPLKGLMQQEGNRR